MIPDVTETMCYEHITDFRKLLRTMNLQIQEFLFFYKQPQFNIQIPLNFHNEIESISNELLHTDIFSERRKIIEKFKPIYINFQNNFESNYFQLYDDIKTSLSSITQNYASSQDAYKVPDFEMKNSTNFIQFIDPFKSLNHNQDYQAKISEIYSKGLAVSKIFDVLSQLGAFYLEFPPPRTPQEAELFLLQKKNQDLESKIKELTTKNKSLEKDSANWKSKYLALEREYKNMDQTLKQMKLCFYQVQKNVKEDQNGHENQDEMAAKMTEEEKAGLDDVKTFLNKYLKSNHGEFDYDSFTEYLSEHVDDFEDILYSLDLL